jgi:hypothetical protein
VEDTVDILGWVLVPTADGCGVDEDIAFLVVMYLSWVGYLRVGMRMPRRLACTCALYYSSCVLFATTPSSIMTSMDSCLTSLLVCRSKAQGNSII